MSKYCRNCGTELKDSYKACFNCGTLVDSDKNSNNGNSKSNTNYFAVSGFIVSIVSSALCCGLFNIVSLGLSIAGLATCKVYNDGKGFAIAGIIISILPMIMIIISAILSIMGVVDYAVPINGYHI